MSTPKRIVIGDQTFKKETVKIAVDGWTREAIQFMLRETAIEITGQQARMGNLASTITVDGSSFKKITDAERRVVVVYGFKLAHAVISAIKGALRATIDQTTRAQSGFLRNLEAWEWTLVPGSKGGSARIVDPYNIPLLNYSDRLIIRPKAYYASVVNSRVRSGGRSITLKSTPKAKPRQIKANSNQGFFGAAANLLRRRSAISNTFSVYAAFTSAYAHPGEVWKPKGARPLTAQIILRPKRFGRLR